ncbi:MAG: hypothetical protein Q8S19_05820 [Bacillota bacterium]|nr:hypothetical protein [Bacillota bacterium]
MKPPRLLLALVVASVLICTISYYQHAKNQKHTIGNGYVSVKTEVERLRSLRVGDFSPSPELYDASLSVAIRNLEPSYDHIVFELVIKNPKVIMADVRVTYILADDVDRCLVASSLSVTNALAENPVTLSPTGTPGLGVSRAFVLRPRNQLVLDDLLESLSPIKASIMWTDSKGNVITDSYLFRLADIVVDDSVRSYFR